MDALKFGFVMHDWKEQIDASEVSKLLGQIGAAHFIQVNTYQDSYGYAIFTRVEGFTEEELNLLAQELYDRFHDAENGEDELLTPYFDEKEYMLIIPMDVVKEVLEQAKAGNEE